MNKQTELEKAMEEVGHDLQNDCPSHKSNIRIIHEAAKQLSALEAENQRLFDLVRYQRAELHQAELISDEEYTTLLADSKSKARLETYDAMRENIKALEAKCAEKDDCIKWLILNPTTEGLQKDFITHKALSSTCGQSYIHKDKVREIVNKAIEAESCYASAHPMSAKHALSIIEDVKQLAKAEGLIE